MAYLNLNADHMTVRLDDETVEKFTTREELLDIIDQYGIESFMCSSSLDFPREYTDNEELVQLCNEIRGNNV